MFCSPQPPAGLIELLNKQSAEHPYRRRVAGALGAVDLEATPAQREAGNFRMGHVRFHGLDLSIEWPAGSTRVGTGKDGRTWRRLMKASYGYLKRTEGADGEHIDVYLGDHPESELVFVVDQLKGDGSFDEHKVVLGTTNIEAARKLYLAHYPAGWKTGKIVPMTMARFKKWVETGATWKPAASTVKAADLLSGVQLQPHQQRIQELAADHPIRMLLVHALGSGKTPTALAAAEAGQRPYSVVAPAALRSNWQSERAKFTDQKTPAEVLSYSELAKGRQPAHADTLIFDEAHRLRNPGSKQTQAAFDAAEKAQNLLLLSGTPLQNRPGDVAPLMSLLTRQTISPDDFEKRYVGERTVSPGLIGRLLGVTPGVEPAVKHRAELERMLQGHVDYYAPDRPTVPVDRQDYEVEMSPQQAQLYKAMHDELPWMLRWKLQRQFPLSRSELRRALTFLSGPRQVGLSTYPFMKGQDRDPYRAYEQSSKLQKAYELMKETLADPRKKAIVFSSYIDAGLRPYAAALARDNVPHAIFHGGLSDEQRRRMVADYNANKLRVALVGPAGAEGISLRGAQLQQILDPHFNPVRNRQAEGRGLRFDSHEGLPEDLRNMKVQRFISKMPLGAWDKVLQAVGVDRARSRRAADDYLRDMEARKERAVGQFADLLKDVGSKRGTAPSPPDDLARLLQAKNYSDHRAYDAKYALVLPMIRQKPEDWIVDEDDGRTPYAGVTHRPSGFRLHLPRAALGALQGSAT